MSKSQEKFAGLETVVSSVNEHGSDGSASKATSAVLHFAAHQAATAAAAAAAALAFQKPKEPNHQNCREQNVRQEEVYLNIICIFQTAAPFNGIIA